MFTFIFVSIAKEAEKASLMQTTDLQDEFEGKLKRLKDQDKLILEQKDTIDVLGKKVGSNVLRKFVKLIFSFDKVPLLKGKYMLRERIKTMERTRRLPDNVNNDLPGIRQLFLLFPWGNNF